MACPIGMPDDEFQKMSYFVAFLYGNYMMTSSGEPGVLLFETTNVSANLANRGEPTYWHKYQVFFIPFAVSSQIIGNCWHGRCLGMVENVYPLCRQFPTMQEFLHRMAFFAPNSMYEGFSGFSYRERTTDGEYHAIDLYIKPPDLSPGRRYHWFVLLDVVEPINWYNSSILRLKGYREFDEHFIQQRARI